MNRYRLTGAVFILLAQACGSLPTQKPPTDVPLATARPQASAEAPPQPAGPPPDPSVVSVAAVRPPPKLAIDGDLREWGSLLPPREAAPPPKVPDGYATVNEEPKPLLPSGPNPPDAASHLAISVTNDALLIAADLGEPAKDGIWLGIASPAPPVPSIGEYRRGGGVEALDCEYEQIPGPEGSFSRGKKHPPETVKACKGLIERHAAFVAKHEERFSKLFKIDRDGIHGVKADGTLFGFDGGRAVFVQSGKSAKVEISLPLQAMPRLAEAPLVSLHVVAMTVTSPGPAFAPEQWVWVKMPEPVSFEPYGELRNRGFEIFEPGGYSGPGPSYQPGDPLHMESVYYGPKDRHSVVAKRETIYQKAAALGDIEVGFVTVYSEWLAVLKNGKLVREKKGADGSEGISDGDTQRGIVTRNGELHVITFSDQVWSEMFGVRQPYWSVRAVSADGRSRQLVQEVELTWDSVSDFANKDLDTFGLRGVLSENRTEGLEVTWKWDPSKKIYAAEQRKIPVPKKPKRK